MKCSLLVKSLGRDDFASYHFYPKELFGMMEASLQEFRQVVMLGGTYEAWYRSTRQRTTARVQVVQEDSKRIRVELDY